MSPRDDILRKIRKEEKRLTEIRKRIHDRPECMVLRCIEAIEASRFSSECGTEFAAAVYRETEELCRRLQGLAGGPVNISIRWNQEARLEQNEDNHDAWKELRITGVNVEWPDGYAKKRQNKEELISIDRLFMEGMLD